MKKNKLFMIVAAAAMLVSCGGGGMKLGDNEFPVRSIKTQGTELQTSYPATIKGVQDVEIRPKISGFITKVCVNEGQAVRKGQTLFVIDNVTYEAAARQAKAAVVSAEASLKTAKLAYENSKSLYEGGVIGDFEWQSAQNTYETAKAGLAQAQAAYASAKQNLDFCYVSSPADGVVGTLPYKVGALVSSASASPLTTVSDISSMEVYFSMTEKDVLMMGKDEGGINSAVAAMPSVKLRLADGTIYGEAGKITKASGVIDAATGTITLVAQFPNPNKVLRSGGAGQVIIPTTEAKAILVPQEATSEVQNKKFVYVVDKENKVRYTEITVNPQSDGNYYIVTSGLKEGDKFVSKGITKLSDGMEIIPITEEQYQKKIDDAIKLGENQGSATAFIDMMSGK
ncbi:MAG: efflux RND transporter periplasmic adaptor subunit [Prevotella sp.]|nr:efflux RND transporter periplasmic adaptor subunit [Prevotella sp.]MBR2018396.1 efflux RND transporter periplasmic adaptor subunit [Prevotella sp.]MBR7171208.1 efflux RND transporter periplasmic adaptor subunit [Prevotella sp.]